ncbi:MAG: 4-hydroxybenzoate octaprenyltransferase [Alphaproteobacteria bacterium]|nr:4-hydroxybenzoate octaprenyltransferase [Alphaproteobacteria bacterium]
MTDNAFVRMLPAGLRPYALLARLDRPIGTWLLLLPCLWSLALAYDGLPPSGTVLLFIVGAIVMRGAGCTLNDIMDRGIDAQVERTRMRPLPSGQVNVKQAAVFLLILLLAGFGILICFNHLTIVLGVISLALIAVYPLMKRITWWPQLFLGITFNWGALMAWAAANGTLEAPGVLLYLGGVFWTLGYDTVYARQDMEDDAFAGVKSTALLFGDNVRDFIIAAYFLAALFMVAAGYAAGLHWAFYIAMLAPAAHLGFQIKRLDLNDPASCLTIFRASRDFGILALAAITLGNLLG